MMVDSSPARLFSYGGVSGYRIPVSDDGNQNCWLLGAGAACFDCEHLALAYGRFSRSRPVARPHRFVGIFRRAPGAINCLR